MPSLVGWKVVDSTAASGTSFVVDPSSPTGGDPIAVGDFCVLLCVGGGAGSWASAGFEAMHNVSQGTRHYGALRRVRQSGDGPYTVTSPTNNGAQIVLLWFRDFDPTLAGLVIGTEYHRVAAEASTAVPSVTSVADGSLIACFALEATTATEGEPTVSQGSRVVWAPQAVSPQIHTTFVSTFVKAVAGASGITTVTYANSAANGFGFQIALPPATGEAVNPVADFTGIRTGKTVDFADASTDVDGEVSEWVWDFDDTGTATTQNPSHTFAAGTYDVRLTVTDDDGATDEIVKAVVIPSVAESNTAGYPLFDAFSRYIDGTTPAGHKALTGQEWSVYSPPDSVEGGLWDSDNDTAAYLYSNTPAEVTRVGCRFRFDTVGGTRTANTGTVCLGVTNDIANLAARKFRAHIVLTPTATQLTVQTAAGGSLVEVGAQPVTVSKDVEHVFEMELAGTTATAFVDGVQIAQWTDARLAEDAAQHQVFFEPYYNNDAAAVRVRFAEVWANWVGGMAGAGTPVVVASSTAAATSTTPTSITLTVPGTPQAGDWLVAVLSHQTGQSATPFGLSGWQSQGGFTPDSTDSRVLTCLTKPWSSDDPSSFTFTGVETDTGSPRRVGALLLVRPPAGHIIEVEAGSASYGGTAITKGRQIAALSLTRPNALVLAYGAAQFAGGQSHTVNIPSGFTTVADVSTAVETTVSRSAAWVGSKEQAAAGSTGTIDLTWVGTPAGSGARALALVAVEGTPPGSLMVSVWDGTTEQPAEAWLWDGGEEVAISDILALPWSGYSVSQMDDDIANDRLVYWAHRGGSANWPEMTMRAYTNAVWWGARALEVSVYRSSDGVWIMSHDANLTRVTATDHVISSTASGTLLGVPVDTPTTGGVIGRLEDVAEAYSDFVLLIDNKTRTNMTAFLDAIEALVPNATEHVIIKIDGTAPLSNFTDAKARGFKICSYWYADNYAAQLPSRASSTDYIGMEVSADQSVWDACAAYGKPLWGHICTTVTHKNTAVAKGASIVQCAGVKAIVPALNTV